jgi:diaminopimelate decarboxylase
MPLFKSLQPALVRSSKEQARRLLGPMVQQSRPQRIDLRPELWNLRARGAELYLGEVRLTELLRAHGSPLHVVDRARLVANARAFQRYANAAEAPCRAFYSYKTNPVAGVLSLLDSLGVGAEVISPYELWLALELGVAPADIIYNGPGKTDASLRFAIERGVGLINLNHREEIERVASIAAALGKRPRVGLRVATGVGWSGQFGVPVSRSRALHAFAEALRNPHLEVVGVQSHMGRPIRGAGVLQQYMTRLLDFCVHLHERLGFTPQVLDVGGSLANRTVANLGEVDRRLNRAFLTDLLPPEDAAAALTIDDYVAGVRDAVLSRCRAAGLAPPTLYMEPGRAMTGNTQLLLTSVMTLRHESGREADFAVLDAGINLADAVRSEYHQLFPVTQFDAPRARQYRLVGPICTPGDVLYWAWRLPELAPGDVLAIMDAGAYFIPFATSFSYPQPAVVLVDGAQVSVLRRAETFEDMVRFDTDLKRESSGRRRRP